MLYFLLSYCFLSPCSPPPPLCFHQFKLPTSPPPTAKPAKVITTGPVTTATSPPVPTTAFIPELTTLPPPLPPGPSSLPPPVTAAPPSVITGGSVVVADELVVVTQSSPADTPGVVMVTTEVARPSDGLSGDVDPTTMPGATSTSLPMTTRSVEEAPLTPSPPEPAGPAENDTFLAPTVLSGDGEVDPGLPSYPQPVDLEAELELDYQNDPDDTFLPVS